MDIISKPVYLTGKLSGYVNVMYGKIKSGIVEGFVSVGHGVKLGGDRAVSCKKPRTPMHINFFTKTTKPKQKNIRINYLTHHPAAASDPANREFYANLGRDLVESITKDGDNGNLTIVDVSKYEQSAP